MSEPLVSVIVPLYNYSKFIKDCITSIQNQSYKNWELFVIDDCSTDDSLEIAKSFETDSRIKVLQTKKNSGYSTAKNEGIIVSQGELITTLDADDMFTKNSISCRVKAILENDYDFVHARPIIVGAGVSLKDAYAIPKGKEKTANPKVHAQTVMMKRWIHKEIGLYDENLRSRADKEMWIRIFGQNYSKDLVKMAKIKKFVAYYRKHPNSMMKRRKRDPELQKILTKQLNEAVAMREKSIDSSNTRFLEA